jgi:N-carbamoyl-D-amino-acid hydrolase
MRVINVAAAQLGPIQKADSRESVVKRMIALMDEAKARQADLIVYPELALTTFFRAGTSKIRSKSISGSSTRCRMRRQSRCSSAPLNIRWR